MKARIALLIAAVAALATIIPSATPALAQRVHRNIDFDWRFSLGEVDARSQTLNRNQQP